MPAMNVDPSLERVTTADGVFVVAQRTKEEYNNDYIYPVVPNGRRARFEITAPNTQTLVNVCDSSYSENILYGRTDVILKISGISTADTSVQYVAPVLSLVVFSSGSTNSGTTSQRTIFNSSTNSGTVNTAVFQGSTNSQYGVVTGKATFRAGSTNSGTLTVNTGPQEAGFVFRNSSNNGTISGNASFYNSPNSGTLNNDGLFSGASAINTGTVNGHVIFLSGSSNQGGTVVGESLWRDRTSFSSSTIFGTSSAMYFGYGNVGTTQSITVASSTFAHINGDTFANTTDAASWLSSNGTNVTDYTGAGFRYGQWGYSNVWYSTSGEAQAAKYAVDDAVAASWLSGNGMSITQYIGAGTYNNQWGYNNAWYETADGASAAKADHDVAAASWLTSNGTNIAQYTGAGTYNNKWGYNNAWYDTQEEAQTAAGV